VLLSYVRPAGSAARAGLKPGDVLLQVGDQGVASPDDLKKALAAVRPPVKVAYWRGGKNASAQLQGLPLGVRLDGRPAPEAVRAWLDDGGELLRGPEPRGLPGTRREVLALARLVPGGKVLLGSEASEQRLDGLAAAGKLKGFRLVHLATHGLVDWQQPERSRLLLARDRLPDALERARRNQKVYTGELTVQAIRDGWKLDADLVVLSACQSGLGLDRGGDGMLGFAQAFLSRGARSLLLSLWAVDDEATALLMVRFYRNLLGKRAGLKRPMPRAEALREARHWLRNLSDKEAKVAAAALPRGKVVRRKPAVKATRPYAHPYYWAGFILIGDPR
jgi:CHAT domain-containing protein